MAYDLHLDVQGKGFILLVITEFVSKPISTVFQLHLDKIRYRFVQFDLDLDVQS